MPTRLWKFASVLVTAAVVLPAGLAMAHPMTAEADHECRGAATLDSRHGVISQDLAIGFGASKTYMTIYVVPQDQDSELPVGPSVWTEANGKDGLQKTGYVCKSIEHDGPGYIDHADERLL